MSCLARILATLVPLVFVSHAGASALFEDDAVLEISLAGPLSSLIEDTENRSELPFVLRIDDVEHLIKVRVRGKSRTQMCSFPPLRLNFAAKDATQSVFSGQDKLKLVTHCRKNDSAQLNTLEEYSAYRIFRLLSDVSYKVRLLRISYTDTDGRPDSDPIIRYGFLIESTTELANRVGGQPADVSGVSLASLDKQQAATVYIFQYLIGNTDWSLVTADLDDTCCHNGDLVDIGTDRYYVPYDFDLAGLVNARYAKPDPALHISRVTQRRYRGYCMSAEVLRDALGAIEASKEDILGVITEVPGLPQDDVESRQRFLKKFFDQAEDEDKLLRQFERRCLGR